MSSGFSGGFPDFFTGKRSLAEFQQQQQLRQQAPVYLRNVKPRGYSYFLSPEYSPEVSSTSSGSQQFRRERFNSGSGVISNYQINNFINRKNPPANHDNEKKMRSRLQELEKELFLDDDNHDDEVSGVTDFEWSETIQSLLNPKPEINNITNNTLSPSPTTSSSSSCASSSSTVSVKQLISESAEAITDGKSELAVELIARLNRISNARGTPEQRLGFHMASALLARVRVTPMRTEMYSKEHIMSTQLLYDKSPCFKLCYMAANNVIMKTFSGSDSDMGIHVVDFDVGHGLQYVYLLHEIASARAANHAPSGVPSFLKLTTFKDFGNGGVERLKVVGDGLKSLANKLGVMFYYNVLNFKLSDISREGLMVGTDDVLVVNFAFKLSKLPDESVTTENLRDEVLRRVKGLSPAVVTVAEQELNANTASFSTRVNDAFGYYTTFLDSCDATIPRENPDRVKIEEGLSRRIVNSVACEGRDRVERCEVFGKWRARMRMAGFESNQVSQHTVESLLLKLNSGTRGNPGFTVKGDTGGVSFGWLGRTLTVVSAWC